MLQEFGQGAPGQLPESLALGEEPVLEGRRLHVEAIEEVTLIEGHRLLQLRLTSRGHESLEVDDIDVELQGIQGHCVRIDDDGPGTRKRSSQSGEGLPEALSRLGIGDVRPEQRGQPITGMSSAWMRGEVRQQGANLSGRHRDNGSRSAASHLQVTQ
jgi:hypothetical protein